MDRESGVRFTASSNITSDGNLCFRVFKFRLTVINKNICYLFVPCMRKPN